MLSAPDADAFNKVKADLKKIEKDVAQKKRDIKAQRKHIEGLERQLNTVWFNLEAVTKDIKGQIALSQADVESLKKLHKETQERMHARLLELRTKEADLSEELAKLEKE